MCCFENALQVPTVLRQSINDYIAAIFMPYMLQLFMFIVCSLLVYERESGLRETLPPCLSPQYTLTTLTIECQPISGQSLACSVYPGSPSKL